jgi:1,2-dihydroxy-3-keto-5-methylthiopentene dioxygenase
MTQLLVYSALDPEHILIDTRDAERIADELRTIGVGFERWNPGSSPSAEATNEEILDAYADDIERLKSERGYLTADVIHMRADNPAWPALRAKFLVEHTHDEDEVRFFVVGGGSFYLHVEDRVLQIAASAADLLSVPAHTKHWFDGGDAPHFTCIRVFSRPEGWVARYTGDAIASSFPTHLPS